MLTARLPFQGASYLQTVRAILTEQPPPLGKFLPGPVHGLDAVCRKALAKAPADRYQSAQAFIDDLDRYAAGRGVRVGSPRPLRVVRRWLRPAAAAAAAAGLALGCVCSARYSSACDAAALGGERLGRGEFAQAEAAAEAGLRHARDLPGCGGLSERLTGVLAAARRGRGAAGLNRLAERVRYEVGPDDGGDLRGALLACDTAWADRERYRAGDGAPLGAAAEDQLRTDLLDLAVISADLKVRLRGDGGRAEAVARLREAEALLGPSPAFDRLRVDVGPDRGRAGGDPDPTMTAWEAYARGRSRLGAGDAAGAVPFLHQALRAEPRAFWPNYYAALAALRCGRPDEAVAGFSVCLAVAPSRRGLCFYNRALAYQAAGNHPASERDLDSALESEPGLAAARTRRGAARLARGDAGGAAADLEGARESGHAGPDLWYHLAFARELRGDHRAALDAAGEGVRTAPADARCRDLLAALRAGQPLTLPPTATARSSP